jgi:hypothetical protein
MLNIKVYMHDCTRVHWVQADLTEALKGQAAYW